MSYERLLRHRMNLARPTRGLDPDGDERETWRDIANDVPCLFDRWDAAAMESVGRNDVRRRARLFLAPEAPEVRPGDRVAVEGAVWRVTRFDSVAGPAASLVVVELTADDAGGGTT